MRRMLSGFLATAMVASVCATMSFAASPASIQVPVAVAGIIGAGSVIEQSGDVIGTVQVHLDRDGAGAGRDDIYIDIPVNKEVEYTTAADFDAIALARLLNGSRVRDFEIDGKYYTVTLNQVGRTGNIDITISPAGMGGVLKLGTSTVDVLCFNEDGTKNVAITGTTVLAAGNTVLGDAREDANIEQGGRFDADNLDITASDVLISYGDGTPIPLTEDPVGVDKDQNDEGGVQSNKTLYFMIRDDVVPRLSDDSYWKLKITKGDNGKYIKAISDKTKNFSKDLFDVNTGHAVSGTGGSRHRYIKVELNEIYTDDEIKITLDMRLSAKSKAVDSIQGWDITDDTDIKVKDFTFYMKNIVKDADNDWRVGIDGLMLNPVKNDWNEVTYYDEDGDVAFMKFFGDSDTGKFYSKLSTKWEHADYASYFNDQDAYIFQFTGSPNLSSTSRADLQIYSPFVDDDGNETFDPEQAVIYQVVDGDLFDITDSFTYEEGDNGDMAFCTRTRFLGTYIICQKPVDEASNDDVVDLVPDDLVPDDNTNAPVDVTPGNNGGSGSKAPANTGKF